MKTQIIELLTQTGMPVGIRELSSKLECPMQAIKDALDELMNEGDNPPIGIVLCAEKNDAVVKYTLPEGNNQIFASKYLTYLPTEDELKRELRLDEFTAIDP